MRRFILIAAAATLLPGGCVDTRPAVEFPALPDLSEETQRECPPAPAVTGELGDLAAKDAALAIEYAKCSARRDTAVGAYRAAQAALSAGRAKAGEKRSPTSR